MNSNVFVLLQLDSSRRRRKWLLEDTHSLDKYKYNITTADELPFSVESTEKNILRKAWGLEISRN